MFIRVEAVVGLCMYVMDGLEVLAIGTKVQWKTAAFVCSCAKEVLQPLLFDINTPTGNPPGRYDGGDSALREERASNQKGLREGHDGGNKGEGPMKGKHKHEGKNRAREKGPPPDAATDNQWYLPKAPSRGSKRKAQGTTMNPVALQGLCLAVERHPRTPKTDINTLREVSRAFSLAPAFAATVPNPNPMPDPDNPDNPDGNAGPNPKPRPGRDAATATIEEQRFTMGAKTQTGGGAMAEAWARAG
ncbi:unnamed protein product, partial [Discosporangium mesarthrocarpum]